MEIALEILKYTLPSVIVFLTAWALTNSFYKNEAKKQDAKYFAANRKDTLPLRLQAYERLIIFLERIHPSSLIPRSNEPGMTVRDFQQLLIESIKTEFEHNLSQQIYVSPEAWATVRFVKDDAIKMVNLIATSIPQDAPSMELAKKLLEYYLHSEQGVPAQKGLNVINLEVKKLF